MEASSQEHHIVPIKYYIATMVALFILTVITVYTAKFVDLGKFNIVLAMIIATFKASLVLLFFIGLRWDKGFNVFILVLTLVFCLIFITMIFFDNHFRGSVNREEAEFFDHQTPVKLNLDKEKIKFAPH